MKEMTLQDIQKVSLDIMVEIDSFCRKNNLQYSLVGGAMIGAIRHKGFVPWDDDIDIAMHRPDFDRFCKLWENSSKYKLFSFSRRNVYSAVARVCEMKETYVKPAMPLYTEETGVWVDILPYDSIPDEPEECKKYKKRVWNAHYNTLRRRTLLTHQEKKGFGFKRLMVYLYLRLRCPRSINYYVKKHDDICKSCGKEGKRMELAAFPVYSKRDFTPKTAFTSTVDVAFEGHKFMAMIGYDEYLRMIFGNYMQLPPEDKRVNHSFHQYFWR